MGKIYVQSYTLMVTYDKLMILSSLAQHYFYICLYMHELELAGWRVSLTVGGGRRPVARGCGIEGGAGGWPRNVFGGSRAFVEG